MSDQHSPTEMESEDNIFPVEPRYHPIHRLPRKIYDFFASAKLAISLLVLILACCLTGVTLWRGVEAGKLIFGTFWFNGILVLLVINIACCFFGRIWRRRVTVISFGMILFHLSFVSVLLAVVYNSLFYFRANIRLTEGETLQNSDPNSYDLVDKGRFFSFSRLKGETSLVKMYSNYKVAGNDKRAAYQVTVGDNINKKTGIIYITHKLSHNGVDYFNDNEGYSLLLTLSDKLGQARYGAYFPLQSIRLKDGSISYTSGYKEGDKVISSVAPFPAPPENPQVALQAIYIPSKLKELSGETRFKMYALDEKGMPNYENLILDRKSLIGDSLLFNDQLISAKEVRYWASMNVRYEPGKTIVLFSLCAGLIGMIITTVGRILKNGKK